MKPQWNVFRINGMQNKVDTLNVFQHGRFLESTIECLKKSANKKIFSDELKRQVMYYFAWKFEYEVCITSVFSHREKIDEKIDIRHQLLLNWNRFVDYLWSNKEEIIND